MASDFRHSNTCFGISKADGVCHSFDDVFFHLAMAVGTMATAVIGIGKWKFGPV